MSWLPVALLGGIVGVDAVSFGQVMLSRPLVAGALTGAALGRPLEGTLLGALIELLALAVMPVGASRYPEPGPATVAAVAAYIWAIPAGPSPEGMLLALGFALVLERISGATVHQLRFVNERLVGERALERLRSARALEVRHLTAIGLDFLRATVLTLLAAWGGAALFSALLPFLDLHRIGAAAALSVAAAALAGGGMAIFGGWEARRGPFLFGVLVGCGLLLVP